MTSHFTLWGCLYLKDDSTSKTKLFQFTAPVDARVLSLQTFVYKIFKNALRTVDSGELKLWKLKKPIPCIPNRGVAEFIRMSGDAFAEYADELDEPGKIVSEIFQNPDADLLHIIVQAAASATISPSNSDDSKLSDAPRKHALQDTGSDEGGGKRFHSQTYDGGHSETRQTAAHGVGRGSSPPTITLDDAIQQALKLAATTDPQVDDSNPFFVDGLGALYSADPSVRDRIAELFEPGKSMVLFNTSGSGKTRLLVEGLCRYWGFYFTANLDPRLGSLDLSRSIVNIGSFSCDGIAFVPNLPDSPKRRSAPFDHNQTIARTVLLSVLLARLLVLEAFLQAGADVPADELRRRWTYLQLMPSVLKSQFSSAEVDIFDRVYRTIERHGDKNHYLVTSLIGKIRQDPRVFSNSPIFMIVDDAQMCADKYEEAFHSKTNGDPDGNRSVLREVSHAWGRLLSDTAVLFSGTGFSLTKVLQSLASSMGAIDEKVFTDMGAFASKEHQAAYITRHVVLHEDTREEVLRRAWRWLRGRHRFTGGFVYVLRRCGTKNASALLTHYFHTLTGYTPKDGSHTALTWHEIKRFPAFKSISQYFQKLDTDDCLRQRVALAINTFMLRHRPHFVSTTDANIIELGIARYTTSSEGSYKSIVIDEPLIIASALKHFESVKRMHSIEETLRESICRIPIGPIRGYDLEAIGMYVLAQQLDGTKSLREIFNFRRASIDIGEGKAQLIAIDEINKDGSLRYTIVTKPWLYPFGMGFEADNPSEHERWFKGTGVPFCFPDPRSGHDVGFFVLLDGRSIVFVTDQFKSYNKDLTPATTKRALKSLSPAECYKDKNGKIYTPGKSARQTIHEVLRRSNIPCLGVLSSFPSNPHLQTINQRAPEHFALFDFSNVEGELGRILIELKADQFPDAILPEWPVEDD